MPFALVQNNIVQMDVDAVVNAANSALAPGGGVCGAIFAAADFSKLERACRRIGRCEVGQAVMTPSFGLKARYVIHAVGPIWQGGLSGERTLLRSAYRSALELAEEQHCRSIAFPVLSSGIYGYPKEEAFRVAAETIRDFVLEHEMEVYLVLFGDVSAYLNPERFSDLRASLEAQGAEGSSDNRDGDFGAQSQTEKPSAAAPREDEAVHRRSLTDLLFRREERFYECLLRFLDEKGMTDMEVYRRANLNGRHFSRLRRSGFRPGRQTVLALAIALRLNLDETAELLRRADYVRFPDSRMDRIVCRFIERREYDVFAVNEALFFFGEKTLGA